MTKSIQEILSCRMTKLIEKFNTNSLLDIGLDEIASMTDQELLSLLVDKEIEFNYRDNKARKKMIRLQKGRAKFNEMLAKHGGCLNQNTYSKLVGKSRQTINNHVHSGALISVRSGESKVIPIFQFDESTGQEVFGLKEINLSIEERELGSSSACSFWLSPRDSLEGLSPRDYLVKYPNPNSVSKILLITNRLGEMGR
ncbi:hypothetical protein [Vibrio owensii]|uniref:hypothetical protein n=1 Tax=Vibrio harveyi group TaxID=717610 RepID=UPI003CC6D586